MKLIHIISGYLILLSHVAATGQSISTFVPKEIEKSGKYLFYLHGGVVTVRGNNAINQSMPEWGPYEYLNILDSLRTRGFNVISENRREGIENAVYVDKLSKQIDTLIKSGVAGNNILIVGASAGWDILLHASSKLRNPSLRFVVMGGCWPDTYKDYIQIELFGHFLSIIESSDPHGTCSKVFMDQKHVGSYKEVMLHTGLSHGFIYKGLKEWIDPIVKWFKDTN